MPAPRWPLRVLVYLGRAVLWIVLLVAVVAMGVLDLMRRPAGQEWVRGLALAETSKILPGLRVGRIGGDLTGSLELDNVVLKDRFGGEAIAVRGVRLRYDVMALLKRGVIHVERVELDRPVLRVGPAKNGKLNLAELVVLEPGPEPPPSEPTSLRLELDRLRIRQGELRLETGAAPLTVDGLEVDLGARAGMSDISATLRKIAARVVLPDGKRLDAALDGRAALDNKRLDAAINARVTGFTPTGAVSLALEAAGPHSRVGLKVSLGLPGRGALSLGGWAGLDEQMLPHYALTARAKHLDPSQILAGLIAADVSLELGAKGDGVPLAPASKAELDLAVGPSTVHGFRLSSLDLEARAEEGRWTLERLKLRTPGGTVGASGTGTLERVDAKVDVSLPRLDRLPARVKRLGVPPDLRGGVSLSARVNGPFRGPLGGRARLKVRELAVAGIRLAGADLSAAFRGLPASPSGSLSLHAEGLDPGDRRLTIDRADLSLKGTPRRLQLELAADGPRARARIATDAALSPGFRQVAATLGRLELSALGYRVALRNTPRVEVQPGRRIALSRTRLALLGGVVEISGELRPAGFPRLTAQVNARGVRPPGLRRTVNAAIEATLERDRVVARIGGELPSLGTTLRLAARLPVRYRPGSPFPAGPELKREGELSLQVQRLGLALVNELAPKLPKVGGEADLDLKLSGKLDDPDVALALDLRRARFDEVSGIGASTRVDIGAGKTRMSHDLTLGNHKLVHLEATTPTTLGPLLGGGPLDLARIGGLPLTLALAVEPTRLSTLPRVHPLLARLAGTASARLQVGGSVLRPTAWLRTQIKDGSIDGGEVKLGTVVDEVTLAVEADQIRLGVSVDKDRVPFLRAKGTVGLALDQLVAGKPPGSFPLALEARVPSYPLERLSQLNAALADLSGRLDLKVKLGGLSTAPTAEADVKVTGAGYTGARIGDLALGASFDGKALDTHLRLKQPKGGSLTWRGVLRPLAKTISGRLRGQKLDLAILRRLAPPVKESAGKLDLDLKAEGALAKPVVTGAVTLKDGELRLRGLSTLKGIGARVELKPRQIRVVRVALRGDKGTLTVSGNVDLSQEGLDATRGLALLDRFDVLVRARKLGIDTAQISGLEASANVSVTGGLKTDGGRPRLAVKVKVDDGMVKVPKVEGGRDLHSTAPLPDVVYVDEKTKEKTASAGDTVDGEGQGEPTSRRAAPAVGLRIEIGADPLFVRGEEVDLEVVTNLVARTDAQGRIRLKGQVEIRRGRIQALNNTFDVRQATVSFSGEVNPDPALNILLAREGPEATVLVQLTGTASAPELALRSDPPIYDRGQIMSLLLTGRVDAKPESGGEGDQTMAVANAVSQVLLGSIARKFAPKVGLDVAKVSLDEAKNKQTGESQIRAEAEVGKYITDRLYLAYRRVFGATAEENSNEALMEYRISARWLITALFGDAGVGGVDIFWNLRY